MGRRTCRLTITMRLIMMSDDDRHRGECQTQNRQPSPILGSLNPRADRERLLCVSRISCRGEMRVAEVGGEWVLR